MSKTLIRGSTQIMDDSVTLDKLAPEIRAILARQWYRIDILVPGNNIYTLNDGNIDPAALINEVYLNGLLVNNTEYTLALGSITFVEKLQQNDYVYILYQK